MAAYHILKYYRDVKHAFVNASVNRSHYNKQDIDYLSIICFILDHVHDDVDPVLLVVVHLAPKLLAGVAVSLNVVACGGILFLPWLLGLRYPARRTCKKRDDLFPTVLCSTDEQI